MPQQASNPSPPKLIAMGSSDGNNWVEIKSPDFGTDCNLKRAIIMRYKVRQFIGGDGLPGARILRQKIIADSKEAPINGKIINDDDLPGGMYLYVARVHYNDGSKGVALMTPSVHFQC